MPIANRNRVETERLIGFFVNTQVLKADLDGRMGFDELLAQARQRALEAQAHQDLPFEQLVDFFSRRKRVFGGFWFYWRNLTKRLGKSLRGDFVT